MIFGAAQQAHILATAAELERSKQSLEQSNLLLYTALKNMAHGLCMFDCEQRLVVCNERYGEMYGLGPEQIKPGTTLRSILEARVRAGMSPHDTEQYIETRLDEVAKRIPYYVENVLRDGHIYAVSHRPMPEGGWVATHIDITEQRRAEQELDETRKFLVSIIENIPVSVVVKDAKTRKYLLVNRAFETMLGIPRSEMLDRTSFDIHRPKDAKSHRRCRQRIAAGQRSHQLQGNRNQYADARSAHAVDAPHGHQEQSGRAQMHHRRHRGRHRAQEGRAAHRLSGAP